MKTIIFAAVLGAMLLPGLAGAAAVKFPYTLPASSGKLNIQNNPQYEKDLLLAMAGTRFTQEELDFFKTTYGSVPSIPGILDSLRKHLTQKDAAKVAADRRALQLWDDYFSRAEKKTLTLAVPASQAPKMTGFLRWFKYNHNFIAEAKKADTPSLVSRASAAYSTAYFDNRTTITKGLKFSKGLISAGEERTFVGALKDLFRLVFGERASAQSGGDESGGDEGDYSDLESLAKQMAKDALIAYVKSIFIQPFGGRITISNVCTTGELLTISAPSPASTFLYWWVYGFNPFPYKVVTDGNWILGNAFRYGGWCNQGYANYISGTSFVLYFGTAAGGG